MKEKYMKYVFTFTDEVYDRMLGGFLLSETVIAKDKPTAYAIMKNSYPYVDKSNITLITESEIELFDQVKLVNTDLGIPELLMDDCDEI